MHSARRGARHCRRTTLDARDRRREINRMQRRDSVAAMFFRQNISICVHSFRYDRASVGRGTTCSGETVHRSEMNGSARAVCQRKCLPSAAPIASDGAGLLNRSADARRRPLATLPEDDDRRRRSRRGRKNSVRQKSLSMCPLTASRDSAETTARAAVCAAEVQDCCQPINRRQICQRASCTT